MSAEAFPERLGFPLRQEGGLVPHVVRCCVEEVERRGMDEVGIYRVSGAAQDIGTLKATFHTSKALRFLASVLASFQAQDEGGSDLHPLHSARLLLRSGLREAVAGLRSAEVNVVSGLLKLYFRELPEPLVPTRLFHSLAQMLGKNIHPPETGGFALRKNNLSTRRNFSVRLLLLLWTAVNLSACSAWNLQAGP